MPNYTTLVPSVMLPRLTWQVSALWAVSSVLSVKIVLVSSAFVPVA